MDSRPRLTRALIEMLEMSDNHDTLRAKELALLLTKSHHTVEKQWELIIKRYEAHGRWEAREKWRASKE